MNAWTEQLSEMSQVWGQSQKSLWEGWSKIMTSNPTQGNGSGVQQAAESFKASQEAALRLVNLMNQGWTNALANVKDGQNWQQALTDYMKQMREQISAPTEWMQASQDAGKLWQLYVKQWQVFAQPWLPVLQQAPQSLNQGGSTLVEWSQLFWDAYDGTFGQLIDSPGVGLPRELNTKLKAGFLAWQKKQQATAEYQILIGDILAKAIEKFMQQLAAKAQKNEPVHTVREFIDLWTETADNVFVAEFEGEKYIAAQWNLLNGNTAYQLHQREITELILQMNDLPTLSQIDEANRNIYQQNKEIKALKKAIAGKGATAPVTNGTAKLQQTVDELRQEVASLKQAHSLVAELQQTISQLQLEMAALKGDTKAAPRKKSKTPELMTEGGNN